MKNILHGFMFVMALLSIINFLGIAGGGLMVELLLDVAHIEQERAIHIGYGVGFSVFVVTALLATLAGALLSGLYPSSEEEYLESDPWLGLSSGG